MGDDGSEIELTALELTRVISSARLREAALLSLVSDEATLDDLAELESASNARLMGVAQAGLEVTPAELVADGRPGSTIINAAFTHPRPAGNRFSSGRRGAWYAAPEVDTCLAEVRFHLERELSAIGWPQTSVEYVALHAPVGGRFADLRGLGADPILAAEPAVAYPAGQAMAARLRSDGFTGAIYPSVRRPPFDSYVVFVPRSIGPVREGAVYRMTWSGGPGPTMTQLTR